VSDRGFRLWFSGRKEFKNIVGVSARVSDLISESPARQIVRPAKRREKFRLDVEMCGKFRLGIDLYRVGLRLQVGMLLRNAVAKPAKAFKTFLQFNYSLVGLIQQGRELRLWIEWRIHN